ncbi:MAG: methionyl-tRNA formyltransferase [Proteobacteria bacterium]|nr:methionyl-tRNA formyltransferase [Pseudomonadota bacterium]
MGTPDFSVPILSALIDAGHDVAAVYSQPPRPAGRGQKERLSPVHAAAVYRGMEVRTPKSLKDAEAQTAFAALDLDAAVVAAYGLLLPKAILDAPRLGCINVHASLLPRWRGAAPIQRAILAGDKESGVTIMQMDVGLDTGDMLLAETVPITGETTGESLHDALSDLGAVLILKALDGLSDGTITPVPQPDDGVTLAPKIGRDDGRLDWSQPAVALERAVRAFSPWPGAWFTHKNERIKVLAAEVTDGAGDPGTVTGELTIKCGEQSLRLTRVQRAGKGPMAAADFLRGYEIPTGTRLD